MAITDMILPKGKVLIKRTNASQIEWDAHAAIQSYCDWKSSPNAAIKDSPEAATYYNEKRLLRANLNPMTITDLKQVLRENFTAAMKN